MQLIPTAHPEVLVLEPKVHGDHRGFFLETFRASVFEAAGLPAIFVQDNHSKSGPNILRGLHYQIMAPQGKLVRCIAGEVFDVAVDIRKSSPRFGQWVGVHLSADNKKALWIPPGFAHGFLVTSNGAEITYKCTTYYAPQHDRSLRWDDPQLAIGWPITPAVILSDKDRNAPMLQQAELFP
ncbi:MAG TPA: dTDP-4-dehydrorhamnose 3,5-epimerase [Candidatus Acidoferrum sp.]|nr:dTDP-4-dehydrorhamnose 3,5-epimerase [Candidatus Acidoferrum sp.]